MHVALHQSAQVEVPAEVALEDLKRFDQVILTISEDSFSI